MSQQLDINALTGTIERPYGEWLTLVISTTDRETLFDYAKHISLSAVLREPDRETLKKAIAKRLGCTIKTLHQELVRELEGEKEADAKDDRELAQETLGLEAGLLFSPEGFYRWRDSGVWSPAHEREIRNRIGDTLAANGLPVKNRTVSDVLGLLKDEAFDTDVHFDQVQADRVNVANGTLELKSGEWTLREHRKDDYLTQQLPVSYDPDAQCPRFLQFLAEVFQGDKDAVEKGLLILEMMGYTLLKTCAYEKFIILTGSGSNGKSVLLKTLQALLGENGYSAVTPADLSSETSRFMLRGKLANIVPELPAGSMLADDAMKSFTSGEAASAKKLFADKITFTPFATLWMGTNSLPHSRDLSRGMFRRALLVNFGQSFEGREDVTLIDKLSAELPGILAAACKAFAGVVTRGKFTIPASCDEASKAWRMSCDQVAMWAQECALIGADQINASDKSFAEKQDPKTTFACAFYSYEQWAQQNGIKHTVSGTEFSLRLQGLGVEAGKFSFDKKQRRGFKGLLLLI